MRLYSELQVQLFGDFRLIYNGHFIDNIQTTRLQTLLAYLLLHRKAPQSRQKIAFTFWPDSSDAQAHANLRHLIHNLRAALVDAELFIQVDSHIIQWRPDASLNLDVAEFETEAAKDSFSALQQAIDLYQGDLLPNCYDDWIILERERLRSLFSQTLEKLIGLFEDKHDLLSAIQYAERLIQHDPLYEDAYRRLMRLHALNGNRAAALHTFHRCNSTLLRELGVEPSPATKEVFLDLINPQAEAEPVLIYPSLASPPLVGRQLEWETLLTTWRELPPGKPRFMIITGEVGIGKSRLGEELLDWARKQGIKTASAACYHGQVELAFAPLVAWMRTNPLPSLDEPWLIELSRLLPEVLTDHPNLQPPEPMKESWQRLRLFESLARAILTESRRLILFLDDLQWCDLETLDWLLYLFRPQAIKPEIYKNSQILLIGTICLDQLDEKSPQHTFLRELRKRGQISEIQLGPLDKAATQFLATRLSSSQFSPKTLDSIYQETEGNPLFIVELVRGGFIIEQVGPSFSKLDVLPPKIEAAIQSRLDQLSEDARELAKIAAVIGRQSTLEILTKIYGGGEAQLILNLDELWRRHILRDQGKMIYEFTHGKIRDIVYASITTTRRRWLHQQIAQSLEELYGADLERVIGQLAFHHEKAGQIDQAIPYYLQAAEAARKVYANREAIDYYQKCLGLIEMFPGDDARQEMTANVYEYLGDAQMAAGEYLEAEASCLAGLPHLPEISRLQRARLYRKTGNALQQQSRFIEAFQKYDQAEALLGGSPDEENREWWHEWIQVRLDQIGSHYLVRQSDKMDRLAEEVQPVLEKFGTPIQMAIFFRELALSLVNRDQFVPSDQVCDLYRRSLEAARNAGDLIEIAVSWFGLGFMHLWRRNMGEAHACLSGALEIADRTGDRSVQLQCMIYLSILYRFLEQVNQTEDYALRSLIIAGKLKKLNYIGAAQANLAWTAWRRGDLAGAQANGLAALDSFQHFSSTYPFQWLARWILIAASISNGQVADTILHSLALFNSNQQRLPDELSMKVLDAIRAWESGRVEDAFTDMRCSLMLAQKLGYI